MDAMKGRCPLCLWGMYFVPEPPPGYWRCNNPECRHVIWGDGPSQP